jgi:hypothetical protein
MLTMKASVRVAQYLGNTEHVPTCVSQTVSRRVANYL